MKLHKIFLPLIVISANADVLHFKYDGLKSSYKGFRESDMLLKNRYEKAQKEMQEEYLALEKERNSLGENASKEEVEAIQDKFVNLNAKGSAQKEEMRKTSLLIEEQSRQEIENASKSIIGDNVLIESSIVLHGGSDVTKNILSSLNGANKEAAISNKNRIVVGYVDSATFMEKSKEAKKSKAFFEDKVKKLQNRQREFMEEQQNSEDFDFEAAQQELERLNEDAVRAQQLMLDKLNKNILNATSVVAEKEGVDLVVDKKMVFGGGVDLTDKVLEESKRDSQYINSGKSKVASINWDVVVGRYKKAQEMMKNQEKQKESASKELEAKYNNIQKMRDENRSEEEIRVAEEQFGRERYQRVQMFQNQDLKNQEEIVNNIKSRAKTLAAKKGVALMIINGESNSGVYYPGRDFSDELINALNGKK